jgi:hypothetical protein
MAIREGMKNITESIARSHGERGKALNVLVSDTRKTLKLFEQERQKTGGEQAKNLADFVNGMSAGVEEALKGFTKDHKKMSGEQARDLSDFARKLAVDVGAMLSGFEKERGEMSAELRGRLGQEVKDIRAYLKKRLKEFDKAHGEMSNDLKKRLADYVDDLTKRSVKLRNEYISDMNKAKDAWQSMYKTMSEARGGRVAAHGIARGHAAEPAERMKASETPTDTDLERKVSKFISKHPDGVKVSDMEEPLGVARTRLGVIAKGLLEEGKVRKEENLYFPL